MLQLNLADQLIRYIFYFGMIIGSLMLAYPTISSFTSNKKLSLDLRKGNSLFYHLYTIISIAFNTTNSYGVIVFYVISFVFFMFAFMLTVRANLHYTGVFIVSVIAMLLPYIYLRIRLYDIRLESSYEAQELVTELIDQYKINYRNMIEAIDKTIPALKNQPYSRKALYRMSLKLKKYQTFEELENIVQEFNYSIDTQWSQSLANSIFIAIQYGDDVVQSLEDILEDLKSLKILQENNKQINEEGYTLAKYVTPGLYIFSVYLMFSAFGFTVNKFLEHQLFHSIGLKLFLVTIAGMVFSYLVYYMTRKPKNDF